MLLFPVLSVLFVFLVAYVPVFVRAVIVAKKATNVDVGKLNARESGRAQPDLREAMDERSYQLVQRLQASHENQLETLGMYAAGIAASLASGAKPAAINAFAGIYLAGRIIYSIVYAMPPIASGFLRSVVFMICILSIVGVWITVAVAVS